MADTVNIFDEKPEAFFQDEGIIVHNISCQPGLTGLNVGYEDSMWRYDEFADYILEWLLEFALKYSDIKKVNHANSKRFLKQAAKAVYQTEKYKKRGEFGELILHAIIRELFNSQPAISKLYYKTAPNDTVKGFDAVHIVEHEGELELWLGEAKFYTDIKEAINAVVQELDKHTQRDYLKEEFVLVSRKIDNDWAYAKQIKDMMSSRKSLDALFPRICFPVLLTYESNTVINNQSTTDEFKKSLINELNQNYQTFNSKLNGSKLRIHLILLPLCNKNTLVEHLNDKLKGLQE